MQQFSTEPLAGLGGPFKGMCNMYLNMDLVKESFKRDIWNKIGGEFSGISLEDFSNFKSLMFQHVALAVHLLKECVPESPMAQAIYS